MKKYTLITSFIFVLVLGGAFMFVSKKADAVNEASKHTGIENQSNLLKYVAAWTVSADAKSYDIEIFEGTDITKTPFLSKQGLTITTYMIDSLVSGKTYYYRVRAKNGFGLSPWSRLFLLKPILVKTSVTAPVAPVTSTPDTVTINSAEGTITITPGVDGTTEAKTVLLTDKEIFEIMTEKKLVTVQKATTGFLGLFGKRTSEYKTIEFFQKHNNLSPTGHNDNSTQMLVQTLIANLKPTGGTVTLNLDDTITITPPITAGEFAKDTKAVTKPLEVKEVKQISNKMFYKLITKSGLVAQQKPKGLLGWLGIGPNSKKNLTIGAFKEKYGLNQANPNIQAEVLKLIKKKQSAGSTGGIITVDNSGAGTVIITPGGTEGGAEEGTVMIDNNKKDITIIKN